MNLERLRVTVQGAVQGVGFRPFVYRLATELELSGSVANSSQGLLIEVEGERMELQHFLLRLEKEKPALAVIQNLEAVFLDPLGSQGFEIRASDGRGPKRALILPDIATCRDCRREIFDPNNRRYLYPFTNCTHCGPRYSIITALPYDRANTSMRQFVMCADCQREYADPVNRRFHAQPNACPACGPQVELWDRDGKAIAQSTEALFAVTAALAKGHIVALKGIGGFQLLVDARKEAAVRLLRRRKRRAEKPFAVMYPSLTALESICAPTALEQRLLTSPEAPIVLIKRRPDRIEIAPSVAPRNPQLGVMLPHSPLHHILLRELDFPVVATSGNLSDEPICIDEHEALNRLRHIADLFLVHNRPIVRHVDDSVTRVVLGREQILRRARGYAPLPITCAESDSEQTILAVGAHLKNTVALSLGNEIIVSQHIGDLATLPALSAFRRVAADLPELYQAQPDAVVADLHPDYVSTHFAKNFVAQASWPTVNGDASPARLNTEQTSAEPPAALLRYFQIQHHYAHVTACMAENHIAAPVLGVVWDGTGHGLDGTIWGGEFLLVKDGTFERIAHLRQFRLPGGETAIRQPRRTALGLLYEMLGPDVFEHRELLPIADFESEELALLRQTLEKQIHAPITSSAGRLFDAVAALLGLRQRASFEGQAAMELEFAVAEESGFYPFRLSADTPTVIDWQPLIEQLRVDLNRRVPVGIIAARFHNTLAEIIVAVAREYDANKVALTGGCFQNRYLTERAVVRLREEHIRPYWHQRIPPNDGGIALGQIHAVRSTALPVPSAAECRLGEPARV